MVNTIGVLGFGYVGPGIVRVCVESGYQVVMVDYDENYVNKAFKIVNKAWAKSVGKGILTDEQVNHYNTMISTSANIADLNGCDLIIEALDGDSQDIYETFAQLDNICKPETILASSSPIVNISELASFTTRPDKVIGMNFFNLVSMMPLVELVPGCSTAAKTIGTMEKLIQTLGKESITVKESTGLIVNRLIIPYINEAAQLLEEGVASAEQIDKAVKMGTNMCIGPLALADLIGLDKILQVSEYFHRELGEKKHRPAELLIKLVTEGKLGKKTGAGFYEYPYHWITA